MGQFLSSVAYTPVSFVAKLRVLSCTSTTYVIGIFIHGVFQFSGLI
jgi:hypothetical protein